MALRWINQRAISRQGRPVMPLEKSNFANARQLLCNLV